jgi:hypothetical protein
MSVTAEQQQHFISTMTEFGKAILPAKLADTHRNGYLLTNWLSTQGLDISVENLKKAANAQLSLLEWEVEPAKLAARKENSKPNLSQSTREAENDFAAKVRAGEAADAKKKIDAANLRQTELAIAAYSPVDPMGQRIAYGKQESLQKFLRESVEKFKGKYTTDGILKWVKQQIADAYSADEKSRERV